jgi:phosphatidylglycerophosphatase A
MKASGKWRAMITYERKKIHLGIFTDEIAAAMAYDEAAKKYHGEFANLNFPPAEAGFWENLRKLIFEVLIKLARWMSRRILIAFDLTAFVSYSYKLMKRLITTCFGLGLLPIAPGTWGSLPPAAIFAGLYAVGLSSLWMAVIFAMLTIISSFFCIIFSPAAIEATGKKDPGEVVIDEFAGQSLTFLPLIIIYDPEVYSADLIAITIAGFLLFRLFDIIKPWPVKKLEKFPAGWGILADDLGAGVLASICLVVGVILLNHTIPQ